MIRSIGALGAGAAILATVAVAPAVAATPREFHFAGVVDPATVTPAGFTLRADAGSNGPALRVVLRSGRSVGVLTGADTQYLTRTGQALSASSQTDFATAVAANASNRVDTRVRVFIRTPKYRYSKKFRTTAPPPTGSWTSPTPATPRAWWVTASAAPAPRSPNPRCR